MATQQRRSGTKKPVGRRKRKDPNRFLYIAISLIFVSLIIGTVLVCTLVSCDSDEESDAQSDNESNISSVISDDVSLDTSETVSDDISNEDSLPPDEESSLDTSLPDDDTDSKTKAYEDYIGTKYAIDMTEYEQYVCPENEEDFVFLVNPDHPLASDYVPKDLVWCTNIREGRPESYSYIDATANKALEAFLKEAAIAGYDDITVTNAYRSYKTQEGLFNNYVNSDIKQDYVCDNCNIYIDISYYPNKVTKRCNACGSELVEEDGVLYCLGCMSVADSAVTVCCAECGNAVRRPTMDETTAHVLTYSTRPGTSEHQSGLCCDMHNLPATTSAFDNTPEAIWLAENAHRFGFILRYPPNTQHITGIKHESWHFRYVGRTAATEIYERGITLDEYLA